MSIDVRIPTIGESITEGVIVRWIKGEGDAVEVDEPLLELETDKASVEIPAESAGVLHILRPEGETVAIGDVVGRIDTSGASKSAATSGKREVAAVDPATEVDRAKGAEPAEKAAHEPALTPAVRRLITEHDLDATAIAGSGKGGRITKSDVLAHLDAGASKEAEPDAAPAAEAPPAPRPSAISTAPRAATEGGDIERVPMSRLRQRIAERLVQAQRDAAILTTFNEVDMSAVMALRKQYKDSFAKAHGVPLGFMSFFARASVAAVRDVPGVNAQVDGTDILYFKRVHLGVAVATDRGLIVPVVHDADRLSFASIEAEIARLAERARNNKLSIDDLSGGTFSISNGGVFGSLLSTPILNPPQSAILGMHKIEKRPVVIGDEIVIRPMMYLALSYDHRIIDGEQAVTFLVRIKERLEDPSRLLLDV